MKRCNIQGLYNCVTTIWYIGSISTDYGKQLTNTIVTLRGGQTVLGGLFLLFLHILRDMLHVTISLVTVQRLQVTAVNHLGC